MTGANRAGPPRVRPGLQVLIEQERDAFRGARVGLLAHAASVTPDLRYAWDVVAQVPGVDLVALFSPEHGLMGTHQDQEGVGIQRILDQQEIPIYSLYGESPASLRPDLSALEGLDLLLVDLQDVGSRYYTYMATISYCLEACRDAGIEVWVLDRPNPIGGTALEGNLVPEEVRSFVGRYPLPVRHGMTIGELAWMINERYGIGCTLRVVPMEGWTRRMWFDQTGLPWVLPSPNMPSLETAVVYPGTCLLEGTNLSEGRGTTRPFEIVGAPWVDPWVLARSLNALDLPGVRFRPLWFRPTFHKYAGTLCGGIQIHVEARGRFLPFLTGVHIIICAAQLWPEAFDWRREPYEFESGQLAIDLLAGGSWLREVTGGVRELESVRRTWAQDLRRFRADRRPFLLYS